MKPADLFLRVYELFSIVVPGVLFLVVLGYSSYAIQKESVLDAVVKSFMSYGGNEKWLLFILLAFVAGHLIEGVGSVLDTLEWLFFSEFLATEKRAIRVIIQRLPIPVTREFGPLRDAVTSSLKTRLPTKLVTVKNVRRWATTDLNLYAPEDAKIHIRYLDAHRRSVRNIAALMLLSVACTAIRKELNAAGPFVAYTPWVLVVLTWYRHQQLQWRYSQTVFEYFVMTSNRQLSNEKPANPPMQSTGSTGG